MNQLRTISEISGSVLSDDFGNLHAGMDVIEGRVTPIPASNPTLVSRRAGLNRLMAAPGQ